MGLLEALGLKPSSNTRVHMLVSVDNHVAGESYDLPLELADRYILRKYAAGELSRPYDQEELHSMLVNSQVVGV